MMTVILFVLYDFIQLIVQRKDFFRQVGFLNDILLFIIFFTYIGVRFRDSRSYLPEVVSWDGDLET